MKRKRSAVVEAAQTPVTPSRQEFVLARVVPLVQQSAGRVAPLAHSAVGRVAPLTANAAERLNAATVLVTPYTHQAVDLVTPYAQQAAHLATPYVEKVAHLATSNAEKVAHLATSNAEKVAPLATAAKVLGVQAAHDTVEALGPKLDEARERVSPAVEAARGKVTDAVAAAASAPVLVEATKRGRAALAAARGTVAEPEPVVKKGSWIKRLAVLLALAGVAAVVVRKLLSSKDADWQAARPTTPYVPSTSAATPTSGSETAAVADLPVDAVEPAPQTPLSDDAAATSGQVGDGSYIGSEPPEGYIIKGNENSMKYHTPESSGYADTIAEVWFSTEQAAEAAGFVRAQG